MKIKHIAAIAAAMVAGTAFAQSSVTLYGVLDTGVRFSNNADGKGNNATYMTTGTLSNSRFGLKGIEDLGDGLKAGFQLESGFDLGNGGQNGAVSDRIFNRIAKVGLDSGYGSLYFGRQYSVLYNVIGMYEPTDYLNTAGNAPPSNGDGSGRVIPTYGYTDGNRVDNNIYYSGTFGPVTAHLSYGLGGVPDNNSSGSHKAIGLTYSDGGLQLGAAFNRTVSNANSITYKAGANNLAEVKSIYADPNATTYNTDTVTVGGSYTWGPVKGMLGYARNKNPMYGSTVLNDTNQYTYFGGLVYSVTPMLDLTAAYYRDKYNGNNKHADGKADTVVVVADYKLSKRTEVYASYDYTRTGAGDSLQQLYMPSKLSATPNLSDSNTRSGLSVGVRHRF